MKDPKEISTIQEAPLTPQNSQGISIEDLINKALENKAAIATVERIFAMRKDLKAEWAKEEFNKDMASFQSECPVISKSKGVILKDKKTVAYKYAPIEVLDVETKLLRQKYGFSYKTNQATYKDGDTTMVKAVLTVTHKFGHSEDTEMTVPLGNKTEIMSNSQVVAAAYTFAKRYAFKNAFGIVEADEDNEELLKQGESTKEELSAEIVEKLDKATTHEDLVKTCKEIIDANPKLRKLLEEEYTRRRNELEAIDVDAVAEDMEKQKEQEAKS